MRIDSLFTKISLVFVVSITMLIFLFLFYLKFEKEQQHQPIVNYHKSVSNSVMQKRPSRRELEESLEGLSFEVEFAHREILPNASVIHRDRGFETLFFNKNYYLHITTPHFRLLFKDLSIYEEKTSFAFLFVFIFLLLLVLYIWLIKSLKPLKDLKESITKFSNGDLTIECKSDKKDEVAQVANEFDNAVKKISLLLNSRQLFLRTVMHELKTPIAKGRIVSELIDDEKQSNRMISIFEKLDFLINDFAKVEQVVSQNYEIRKNKASMQDLVQNSKNMLMLDNIDEKIELKIKNDFNINVDFDLMSMIFKNLIDNAFRYSSDSKIKIEQTENVISFISFGKKLERSFEEYFDPFHNTTESKNHGMGLGLYIVKSILDMHNMNFEYEYKDGRNIFKIIT